MNGLRTTCLAALCLFILSCTLRPSVAPPEAVRPPLPGPVTVETLKASHVFKGIRTMKSEVTVRVYREGERMGTFKGVFAYMAPDSMRLRLFGPVGFEAVEMLAADGLMQLYLPNKKTLYEGRALSLKVPSGMLYSVEEEGDEYILYALRGAGSSLELVGKYAFDSSLRNTGITVYRDRRSFIEVVFGDFSQVLPGFMSVSFSGRYIMEMVFVNPSVNSEIPPEYFRPFRHEGKTVRPIGDILSKS
jgi:hypothetical protein